MENEPMKKRRGQTDRGLSRKSRNSFRAAVERFENRLLLTTFFVRNNGDPAPGQVQPDDGSLRGEILAANLPANLPTAGNFNTIDFSMLPTTQDTINIDVNTNGPLPALMSATLLDGSTAIGFKNSPVVAINGGVIILQAANSKVQDLSIVGNNGSGNLGDGIELMGGSDTVVGSYIGLNPDGTPDGNTGAGIRILSGNNTIGGPNNPFTGVSQLNVISANGTDVILGKQPGIEIGVGATANTIAYNYIGTDPTGTKSLGNGTYGIQDDSPGSIGSGPGQTKNLIGGQDSNPPGLLGPLGPGNLISGNGFGGIAINSGATNNTLVEGNFIGTDVTGLLPIPNGISGSGIAVGGAKNVTIGGFVAGSGGSVISLGNVISGNKGNGIQVTGAGATNIVMEGNFIGVGSDGSSVLGNQGSGVVIQAGGGDTVGGTDLLRSTKGYGNTIAYNGVNSNPAGFGVEIINSSMDGILTNSIFGNGGLGIKLSQGNTGVQPPTITSVESGGGETRLTGTYFGFPNTPYLIQFFSTQNSVAGNGQTFVGNLDITTDSNGNYSIATTLLTGVPPGNYLSATATELPLTMNNTSQFSTPTQVAVAQLTDLGVTTTVVPPSQGPLLDQPYTYSVTVTNGGPDPATGIVLTDTIPTSSTYISSTVTGGIGTPSIVSGVLTYDYTNPAYTDPVLGMIPADTLPSGASFTVMITVKPTFTIGKFVNTASVTGTQLDVNQANNTSSTTGTVLPNAFLSIAMDSDATPVNGGNPIAPLGSPITYTLIVSNNGPSSSNGTVETLVFNDSTGNPLPASDVVGIVVTPDMGSATVDVNTDTVTVNTGILPAGSSTTIIIMATPNMTGEIDATASVASTTLNPNSANNTAIAPVDVENAADLGVTISSTPASGGTFVLKNQELLYNINVTNAGPSPASAALFTDVLPANVMFDPQDSTPGLIFDNSMGMGPSGTVSLSIGSLLANTSIPIVIAVTPTVSGALSNTVTVGDPTLDPSTSVEIDPDLSNNTASTSTLVSPADLQVTIDQPPSSIPFFIGTNVVYQLTVTNNGPADATNVVLNDSIVGGATIIGTSLPNLGSGNTLTFDLGTIASGDSTTVDVTVDPTVDGYTGSLIDSAAVNTNDEVDPDPTNNNASSSNPVSPVDVGVVATVSPTSVLVGHSLSYVFTVTNAGPATATDVIFNNALPSGVTFNSATSTQGSVSLTSAGTVSGDLLSLAPNGSATVTIFVTPTAVETATDTATVTPFEVDTNPNNNTASASATVFNLPGTIQLESSSASVPENAGSVTLTVDRLTGTQGAVSINYATSNGTGVAGVNYVATSGTVTFADGQSTATITVPVIDDMVINGDHTFFLTLSNPTNGASLGTPSVVAVDVTNTDRDTTPPNVTGLLATTKGSSIVSFTITFDEAMDQTRASNASNYHLFLTNGSTSQSPIQIVSATYNPATDSVTLVPSGSLPNNRFYRVVVNGSFGAALTDVAGNVLFGSSGPNTNYDVTYGQGTNLTYTDSHNNSVNLKLSGGGIMQIYRLSDGDASNVNLLGIVPHKSKITGSVKKLKKTSSGHTSIGSITGFGEFGNVFSSLKTPAFYVGFAPVTTAGINAPEVVTAQAIPVTHVTVIAKKVPKGPKLTHK
jgi:uncharacterized repeat protein (TIGR01451 family)